MNLNNFILEIPELVYDQKELVSIFDQCKPYGRIKGLKWRKKPRKIVSIEDATCLVIQYGENMMLDLSKKDLSYDLLQHSYIKNIIEKFNFSHRIDSGNIDILWYRSGFEFEPHVDHYAAATMMWPIIPATGGAPIDFYSLDKVKYTPGEAGGFRDILNADDIIYTHYYNTTFPTIFNSHWIHGVRRIDHERVYLRLRINESFDSIVKKYKNGTLIK